MIVERLEGAVPFRYRVEGEDEFEKFDEADGLAREFESKKALKELVEERRLRFEDLFIWEDEDDA